MSFNPLEALRAAQVSGFSQDPIGVGTISVPWSLNFFDFISNPSFMGQKSIFPRQAVIGSLGMDEVCYHCSHVNWIKQWFKAGYNTQSLSYDVRYIGNGSSREHRIVLLERGVCGKCKRSRWDLHQEGYMEGCREIATVVGQRSGKTAFTGGQLAPYRIHRLLETGDAAMCYGLSNTELQYTMVAPTLTVAKETLWANFWGMYKKSPWFSKFNEQIVALGKQRNEVWLEIKGTSISYPKHNLKINIAAADPASLRGRTRCGCSVDELSWMPVDKKSKQNAGEILQALKASLQSVNTAYVNKFSASNYNIMPAVMANCSSPKHAQDMAMQLLRDYSKQPANPLINESPDSPPCPDSDSNETNIYGLGTTRIGIHTPSHNFNPLVTWENLLKEFPGQELKLIRDFGARPPATDDPMFDNEQDVWSLASENYSNCMYLRSSLEVIGGVMYNVPQRVEIDTSDIEHPCVLTVDLGAVNNGCGFTLVEILPKGKCRLRGVVSIYPMPDSSIHFPSIYTNIIEPIIQEPIVASVGFDRWNSMQMAQQIHTEYGLEVKTQNSTATVMQEFQTMVKMQQISIPGLESPPGTMQLGDEWEMDTLLSLSQEECWDLPVSLLMKQLLTVRKIGKRFLKPAVGDDDLFRALVLGATYALDPEGYKELCTVVGKGTLQRQRSRAALGRRTVAVNPSQMHLGGRGSSTFDMRNRGTQSLGSRISQSNLGRGRSSSYKSDGLGVRTFARTNTPKKENRTTLTPDGKRKKRST